MPQTTGASPFLLAPAERPEEWPSHVLRARGREYHWSGAGPLSLKTFFGGGGARYRVGGGAVAVRDDAYLVLNHGRHYEIEIESDTPVESFCLFFSPGMAGDVRRSLAARTEALLDEPNAGAGSACELYERTYPPDAVVWPAVSALRDGLAALPRGVTRAEGRVGELLRGVLGRLLTAQAGEAGAVAAFGEAAALLRPATRDELYRRLHRARDHAAACYDRPLTLEEMASVACLSPNHLLRTFPALFGETPHQYLTSRRLAEACRVLASTDLPVTEICLSVGFASVGSFGRLFSRRFGLSPGEYRRRARAAGPRFW